jgi:capsular polysaccharide biosynthesis protein
LIGNILQSPNVLTEEELSFSDIWKFLTLFWKEIFIFLILGLGASMLHIFITPPIFQASAKLKLAEIYSQDNKLFLIDDPKAMLAKLSIPTAYTLDEVLVCGFEDASHSVENLVASTKFTEIKGVSSLIEFTVNRETRDSAKTCAEMFYKKIRRLQDEKIKLINEEYQYLLSMYMSNANNHLEFNFPQSIESKANSIIELKSIIYKIS